MKNYLFITNSRRPTKEVYESKDPIILKNDSIPCIEAAQKLGYKVYMGVNRKYASELKCVGYDVEFYNADIYSSIFDLKTNYIAFNRLCKFIKEKNINVIHCNSPIGGVIGRLSRLFCKVDKVIYTAHGFHFYKGAPFYYNLIFKNIEKILARITDVLITINNEDYEAALKFKLKKKGRVYKVPGVGINTNKNNMTLEAFQKKRLELGLNEENFILISTGDLIKRKNYESSLKALSELNNENIHLLICGSGSNLKALLKLSSDLGISQNVHFLGFRSDIQELLYISDAFIFTTKQEGLPRSLMEAMEQGLPCIVSNIRGNNDLIIDGKGGYLVNNQSIKDYAIAINKLYSNRNNFSEFKEFNKKYILEFEVENIKKIIINLFMKELE